MILEAIKTNLIALKPPKPNVMRAVKSFLREILISGGWSQHLGLNSPALVPWYGGVGLCPLVQDDPALVQPERTGSYWLVLCDFVSCLWNKQTRFIT